MVPSPYFRPLFVIFISILVFLQKPFCQAITTISGNYSLGNGFSGDGGLATNTQFNFLQGIAIDPFGNLFIADSYNHRIRKVDVSQMASTYAGNGISGYSGDNGPAIAAKISYPLAIVSDKFGNLFIADVNNCIRRIDVTTKIITTVAGNGVRGFAGDGGPAALAELDGPLGMSFDNAGNLFIADANNNRIRKVDALTGIITTCAGNGTAGYSGDGGLAVSAQLNSPFAVSADAAGDLYIADNSNHRIRRVDFTTNQIITIAGTGVAGISGDGISATLAELSSPSGVVYSSTGKIYITDVSQRVRVIDETTGIISTVAGSGTTGLSGDGGPAILASLNHPSSPLVDIAGNIYFSDLWNNRIRKIESATGLISTYAGNYVFYAGDGGTAGNAVYNLPIDIEFDKSGNWYVLDMKNERIRWVDANSGIITTLAGNGNTGFGGDGGLAINANFNSPQDMAVDNAGNIFVADLENQIIRRIDGVTHMISTVAGNGIFGTAGRGGPATSAQLCGPNGIAIDKNGNLFIVDWFSSTIERVDAISHTITTVAGKDFDWGYSGDGGQATNAKLYYPYSVDVDQQGNLYIADVGNDAIRRVDGLTHIITTIAGGGIPGYSGDGGPAISAKLSAPRKVKYDQQNNLFIVDADRVRKIDLTTQIITTVAGNGIAGYSGDGGSPLLAELNDPQSVAFDGTGNIYIADYENNVIREIVSTVLPIRLQSFDGYLVEENKGRLSWTSELESQTSYFEIQHSTEGQKFSTLSTIQANGKPSNYNFIHCCLLEGNNFYRLKMVDIDGKFDFSKTVLIKYAPPYRGVMAFPNPSENWFTLRFPNITRENTMRIIDASGSVLSTERIQPGTSEKAISLRGLPKGIYIVEFSDTNLKAIRLLLK